MLKTVYFLTLVLYISANQNDGHNSAGRRYYFKIGKRTNDFKVNNRVYFLNHNITDYDYTHTPVDKVKPAHTKEKNINVENGGNHLLDEEWNFDHKTVTKKELPLFIHKLYENHDDGVSLTTTTRILFNQNNNSSSRIIMFNLNSLQRNETVIDADLYFFWPLEDTSKIYKESVVLRLYQFEKQGNGELNESNLIENPDVHKLFNVIYISKAQRGWQTFKIKKPIANWFNGEENLGLLLTISSYDDNNLISIFNDTNMGIYSTFAIITVKDNGTAANKTDIPEFGSRGLSANCQRKEWNVSFKYLHWDPFIITPDGFTAYDCIGKCLKSQPDDANHVKLLHIFNKRTPCCVPRKYAPLPIMFYDRYGNVVIKNYRNMIITECGCR